MTAEERAELRALVYAAWPRRGTPALRGHAHRIVVWNALRALRTLDLRTMNDRALVRVEAELRRRKTVDELVDLLRRTDPASHNREGVACNAA